MTADVEQRTVQVRGAGLAVTSAGSGRTFVWAHALLSSMADEDAAGVFDIGSLTDEFRVVRYDARGHGTSTGTGRAQEHTWPALAADLVGVLDALGLDRVVA